MKSRKYYGIVEGFFSQPLPTWTWEERSSTLSFITEYASNINSYLYCPKEDPLVTKFPYLKYGEEEINNFEKFIANSNVSGVEFIYGINPIIKKDDLENADHLVDKIISKFEQLQSVGCRNFCLLFDDIPIAYDVFEANPKIDSDISNFIVNITNKVYERLFSEIDSFWFCSPDYCFTKETELTEAMKSLNESIDIFWSGNNIFSKDILKSDISRVKNFVKKDNIALWSNYPVNDAEQNVGCFNLNAFFPPEKEAENDLKAIFVNPMREVYANLPFYISFSQYISDKDDYEREKLWKNALSKLGLDKDTFSLIDKFRTSNAFDSVESKNLATNISFKIDLASKRSTNKYGKLFLKTIKQVFKDANSFEAIKNTLYNKKEVDLNWFQQIDWFPTVTTVSRYYPEIFRIVIARYMLYCDDSVDKLFTPYMDLLQYFEAKYIGKDKLNISKQDDKKILKNISKLIELEKRFFIDFINKSNNTNDFKMKIYLQRRNTNRFSLN